MKLSVFFLFVCMVETSAKSYGQQVTIVVNNAPAEQVFREIERQTGYGFIYAKEMLSKMKPINLSAVDKNLSSVLDMIFRGQSLTYVLSDKSIALKERPAAIPVGTADNPIPEEVVTGTVYDEDGSPLPGVTVILKGTSSAVNTDKDGKFSLAVAHDATNPVLVFSFIGMETQEVTIAGRKNIRVSMKAKTVGLNEVVSVGYGSVQKSDLTGSVAKVTLDDAGARPATSIEQLLQGRAAGVQITSNTGAPGGGMTFSIRGVSSISGSNQPLIVVDGYPIESDNSAVRMSSGSQSGYLEALPDENALANLDPADIASVEILKDASATAIYGSRASNGVVLITTKHGKAGRDRISYNFRYDVSAIPKKIHMLSTSDYLNYSNEAYLNSGQDSIYTADEIALYSATNTNWQDLIYRTAQSQSHQLSLSGGEDKFKYAVNLGYLGQQGVVKNSKYDRGSLLVNLDREVNKRLKVGISINGSISKNKAAMQSSNRKQASTSVIYGALLSRPYSAPLTADDQIDQTQVGNPLTLIELSDDQNRFTTILAKMYLDYTLMPGLDFKVNGGVNSSKSRRDFYMPRGTTLGDLEGGYAYLGEGSSFNYLTEYTLSYKKTIAKKHRINAVTGYTWQQWTRKAFSINVLNFPNDNLLYYDLSSGSSISKPNTSTSMWGLASFIGRVNYSFDNRYLATFTARQDGSTRLSEGNKWKFFPSVALGWNISNEKFMRDVHAITSLKLRASYGLSGNQSVAVGATKARLESTGSVANESIQIGYTLANMANNTLHWEMTKQADFGVDLAMFENRFTFGFDFYKKHTDGLLIGLTIPPSNGFGRYTTNQGSVENKGYEFDLGGRILTGRLKWDASGNISFNRNKVISLGPDVQSLTGPTFRAVAGQTLSISEVGEPIGAFYGYRIIGIYQNEQEVTSSPKDPDNNKPGSFKFKDISGPDGVPDGVISADDREIIGSPYPNYSFGITNNLEWKGFGLSVLVLGSIGQDVINANRYSMDALARGSQANVRQEAYDGRWTGEGTSNKYPQATTSATPFSNRFTDFIVEDASYIRLKYTTISYSFEHRKIRFARNLRLYVTASNLLTFTQYQGYDPEINSHGENSMTQGIDSGSIPQYRTFSMGLNVGF